jgi:hypothetical protein
MAVVVDELFGQDAMGLLAHRAQVERRMSKPNSRVG